MKKRRKCLYKWEYFIKKKIFGKNERKRKSLGGGIITIFDLGKFCSVCMEFDLYFWCKEEVFIEMSILYF